MRILRRLPAGLAWLLLGALLVGVDALSLQAHGHQQLADIGFVLVVAALAFAVAFCDWTGGRRP